MKTLQDSMAFCFLLLGFLLWKLPGSIWFMMKQKGKNEKMLFVSVHEVESFNWDESTEWWRVIEFLWWITYVHTTVHLSVRKTFTCVESFSHVSSVDLLLVWSYHCLDIIALVSVVTITIIDFSLFRGLAHPCRRFMRCGIRFPFHNMQILGCFWSRNKQALRMCQ